MFDPNAGQQQMDPMTAYGQLGQGQTSAIAQEFISRFRNSGDPQAQQYAQLNPNQVTPGQLAEMHQYAVQRQPGILGEVMKHPVIMAALGGFAAYEIRKHVEGRH
jgi:hypothetical protein